MNLSIGQFLNEESKPIELQSVIKAEKEIFDENLNKEYPPMGGQPEFNKAIQNLFFPSDNKVVTEGRVACFQIITGGASLRITSEIIKKVFPSNKKIYTSNETFGPYFKLFEGVEIESYPYYNFETKQLEAEKLVKFLENLETPSFILLQLSSHNPTGLDLSKQEWDSVISALKSRNHIAIFDVAYLGYGTGSISQDLYPIHKAAEENVEMMICYSSSKSFCNYGDCTGALMIVCNNSKPLNAIRANIIVLSRSLFSFNSLYGSRIISKILEKPEFRQLWNKETSEIYNRIKTIRNSFLQEIKTNFKDIDKTLLALLEKQTGVYIYLDLNDNQVARLANEYGIFTSAKGRINITGINKNKVNYLISAIKAILSS